MAKRTVRDFLGDPESWPNYRYGGTKMPKLRGAIIVSAMEVEPDELRIIIEAQKQMLPSTFVVVDRDMRKRLLELLIPGTDVATALDEEL